LKPSHQFQNKKSQRLVFLKVHPKKTLRLLKMERSTKAAAIAHVKPDLHQHQLFQSAKIMSI
jgi:hypothetical protein